MLKMVPFATILSILTICNNFSKMRSTKLFYRFKSHTNQQERTRRRVSDFALCKKIVQKTQMKTAGFVLISTDRRRRTIKQEFNCKTVPKRPLSHPRDREKTNIGMNSTAPTTNGFHGEENTRLFIPNSEDSEERLANIIKAP